MSEFGDLRPTFLRRFTSNYNDGRKRLRHPRLLAAAVAVFCVILLLGAIVELVPSVAATAADNVLRPIIGNKATVGLESEVFALSDAARRLAYGTVVRPNSNVFTAEPTAKVQLSYAPPATNSPSPEQIHALNLAPLNYYQTTYARLAGEGLWTLVALPQFAGQPLMARTFVRPDPQRSYAIVALVQMNTRHLHLHAVAGTQYPGAELGHPGPGIIPADVRDGSDLVAAFNGGFQYKDGHYGMAVGSQVYVPLVNGSGTLTIYQNGTLAINRYTPSAVTAASTSVEAMRQNGPLIVDKGQVTPDVISGGYALWGRTTTNSMYTWRSGVGVTANGNLIYAVGPSLTAQTLAQALKVGGAVEAMQLDINAYWVRFVTFEPKAPDDYTYESILNTLANGGYDYLHGYSKDFFYLTMQTPTS